MTTFEDICRANSLIKTTNLKGKDYAEVNQRIKAFRSVYPEGTIENELISLADGVAIFRATVKNGETVLGVGHAQEQEGSSYINKTSYIENCETSAVGRALGMCGFGIDTSVASFEEVANAMTQQNASKPIGNAKAVSLSEMIADKVGADGVKKVLAQFKINKLEELTEAQHRQVVEALGRKESK